MKYLVVNDRDGMVQAFEEERGGQKYDYAVNHASGILTILYGGLPVAFFKEWANLSIEEITEGEL